jgi:hypothetical protein
MIAAQLCLKLDLQRFQYCLQIPSLLISLLFLGKAGIDPGCDYLVSLCGLSIDLVYLVPIAL